MAFNSAFKTILEAKLKALLAREKQLADGLAAMEAGTVSEFEIDTGEESNRVKYANLSTAQKAYDDIWSQIELIIRRLSKTGIVSVRARRRPQ